MATIGELKVQITGDTRGLDRALGTAASSVRNLEKRLTSMGRTLTQNVTAPLITLGGVAVKEFADFDSAVAGVRKTVDATDDEFRKLVGQLVEMNKRLPASIEEIAGVAEAAGQLGVATENVADFTETMINLGETTNLSAEEAATELARLMNIMSTAPEDVTRLGSTIVDLGNNFATTEAEITQMGARLAGAGNTIGLAETDVLALAAALTSVGIRAEAGGTAFSRVMIEMNNAVEKGGDALTAFADVAGMSVDEFARTFEEDAAEALVTFVEGLGEMQEQGENVNPVLEELGLAGIRVQDALLRSAGAGNMMREAINRGSDAWEDNTALTKEAEQRYGTLTSQLQVLRNRVQAVARDLGENLAGALLRITESGTGVVEMFSGLTEEQQSLMITAGAAAAALGPVLLALGKLAGALSLAVSAVSPIVSAFGSMVSVAGSAGAALTGLGTTVGGLVGAGGAIAVFAGMARAIIQNWDELLVFLINLGDGIEDVFTFTLSKVSSLWSTHSETIIGIVGSLTQNIASIIGNVAEILVHVFTEIRDTGESIWSEWGGLITGIVGSAVTTLANHIVYLGDFISEAFSLITNVITGDWKSAWDDTVSLAKSGVQLMTNTILGLVNSFLIVLKESFSWAPWMGQKIEQAQKAVEGFISDRLKEEVKKDAEDIKKDVGGAMDGAADVTESAKNKMSTQLKSIMDFGRRAFSPSEPSSMTSHVRAGSKDIGDSVRRISNSVGTLSETDLPALDVETVKVKDSVDRLTQSIDEGSRRMAEEYEPSLDKAKSKTDDLSESTSKLARRIRNDLTYALEDAITNTIMGRGGFKDALDGLKNSFARLISEGIAKTVISVLSGEQSLVGAFTKGISVIKGLGSRIGSLGRVLLNMPSQIGSVVNSIGGFISKLGTLGSKITGIGGAAEGMKSKLGAILGKGGGIATILAAGYTVFSNWNNSVTETFSRMWEGVKGIVGNLGSAIDSLFGGGGGDAGRGDDPGETGASEEYLWEQAFGSGWSDVKRDAQSQRFQSENDFVGWAIGYGASASAAIALAGYLFETGNVPGLAEGGLAFGETIARIGDNLNSQVDPEVVAPLSDLKGMISESVANIGGASGIRQTVVVQLDGREIARATAQNLPEYLEVINLR